jgi:hypothetical protein
MQNRKFLLQHFLLSGRHSLDQTGMSSIFCKLFRNVNRQPDGNQTGPSLDRDGKYSLVISFMILKDGKADIAHSYPRWEDVSSYS